MGANLDVNRNVIKKTIEIEEDASGALTALDISHEDQKQLAEIADYTQSGSVNIIHLVNTLTRLRGVSRRSDIISVELVCQGIQEQVQKIHTQLRRSKLPAHSHGHIENSDT